MKRFFMNTLFALMFLAGFGILVYPTVADQWNTYRQSQLITNYENVIEELEEEDFTAVWELAKAYNESLSYNPVFGNWGMDDVNVEDQEYWNALNVAGDGVMGYISIPKIKIKFPIYHGSSETILQTSIGHIYGTMLPIGGENTHSVLAGHRGLPSARLFTDIDQLQAGDMIYIHMLNETFAYQVDRVQDMIPKDDTKALAEAMALEEGGDHITLFTCTPYGVNSHRLLVRGTRVPYVEEEEIVAVTVPEAMLESVQNYYMLYVIMGLSVTLLVIVIMKFLIGRGARKKQKKAKKAQETQTEDNKETP